MLRAYKPGRPEGLAGLLERRSQIPRRDDRRDPLPLRQKEPPIRRAETQEIVRPFFHLAHQGRDEYPYITRHVDAGLSLRRRTDSAW